MFGADAFCIPDGGQVEFLIPVEQLTLVGQKSDDLPARQVNSIELECLFDKLVHGMTKLYPFLFARKGYVLIISSFLRTARLLPWAFRPCPRSTVVPVKDGKPD